MAAFLRFGLSGEQWWRDIRWCARRSRRDRHRAANRPEQDRLPAVASCWPGTGLPRSALGFFVAALGAGLILLLPLLVYPAGMGKGDVKLAMLLGAGLGAQVVSAFVVGFLTAFIFAVGILAVRGGAARKQGIPFVPFLAAGGLVALFFG
jgi:prepilin signal peptidase PulO-like enzyme (type II secretory pathway)